MSSLNTARNSVLPLRLPVRTAADRRLSNLTGRFEARAGSGLKHFELQLDDPMERSRVGKRAAIMQVGLAAAEAATPCARGIGNGTEYMKPSVHIMA